MVWIILGLIGLIVAGLIGRGLWLMMLLGSRKTGENPPPRSSTESTLSPLPDLIPNHPTLTEPYPARPNTVSFPLTTLHASIPLGFGLLVAGFQLVFGCYMTTTITLPTWQTYYLLKDTGVTTEAVVLKRIFKRGSRTTPYLITYQYTAPVPQGRSQQFTKATPVDLSTYESLSVGAHIPILYAATDPAVSRPQSEFEPPFSSLGWAGLPLLFVLVGLGLALWGGRELNQVLALDGRGQMIRGVVFDRWVAYPYRRPPCVAYYFDLLGQPNGRTRVVRAEYNRTAYNTYQVGDSVPIRYLPDNPKICRLEL
jgi:hypothetical protein